MSPERSHAYRRVLQTLAELGPSKLQPGEQEWIRDAADSLIFCAELSRDAAAREALDQTAVLLEVLVESGRWTQWTADRLSADLRQCGPHVEEIELKAA